MSSLKVQIANFNILYLLKLRKNLICYRMPIVTIKLVFPEHTVAQRCRQQYPYFCQIKVKVN